MGQQWVHAYVVDVFCVFRNRRILEEKLIQKRDRHVAKEQENQVGATLDSGSKHLQRIFIAVVILDGTLSYALCSIMWVEGGLPPPSTHISPLSLVPSPAATTAGFLRTPRAEYTYP